MNLSSAGDSSFIIALNPGRIERRSCEANVSKKSQHTLRIGFCNAQNFNNTRHDYEITLEPSSIVELCPDEEAVIPKIQYHVSTQASSISLSAPSASICLV